MSMRIWIIGKNGMLAQALKRVCKKKGLSFLVTSKQEIDITSFDQMDDLMSEEPFTHIINCSAYTAVDKAECETEKAFLVNEKGVEHLAMLSLKHGCKLIHFSTDYVFSGKGVRPYHEKDFPDPLSTYGHSKWKGEKILLETVPHRSLIIRTSWLFGREGYNFPKTMLRLMKQKEKLEVVNDQIGRPTYADDLAEATLSLLDETGIFHFSNGQPTTWFDFANLILKQLQDMSVPMMCKEIVPITTEQFGAKAPRPRYSVLSTEKVEQYLQRSPMPLQDALQECLNSWTREGASYV